MRRDTASYTTWSSGLAMTVVTTNTCQSLHWQTAQEYYVHINVQIVLLESIRSLILHKAGISYRSCVLVGYDTKFGNT